MAPRARFELATLRLTAECSTIELPGNGQARLLIYNKLRAIATLLCFSVRVQLGSNIVIFQKIWEKNPFVLIDSQRLSI